MTQREHEVPRPWPQHERPKPWPEPIRRSQKIRTAMMRTTKKKRRGLLVVPE